MFVEVDGVRLVYEEHGTGEPIVCLHAIGHDRSDFRTLQGGRVIALDWPGQGESSADRSPPSARRYRDLLGGFLDALGLDRVVLVGNSIGGAAAIEYAAAHPERVRALVLMNPGGLDAGGRLARFFINMMVRFFAAGARGARWFGRAFAFYYKLVLRQNAAAATRARIIAAGYELAPLLRDAWRGFGRPEADLRALAPSIHCPTLFAWARHDRFIQFRRSKEAIARFPDAHLELFDAGHAPQLETPEELNAALRKFLTPAPALAEDRG
jgi:4,5:9,10-diseco-3-hydroxy-5,9,17-trioxoandrosta-1(10),2-diene-4-oate hydrolase